MQKMLLLDSKKHYRLTCNLEIKHGVAGKLTQLFFAVNNEQLFKLLFIKAEAYVEHYQISTMEIFYENS